MTRIFAAAKTAAFIFPLLLLATMQPALASTGGGLPWDTPLQTLQEDLTGPVATAVSVLALFAAGARAGLRRGAWVRSCGARSCW